jgi:hypothetical protein
MNMQQSNYCLAVRWTRSFLLDSPRGYITGIQGQQYQRREKTETRVEARSNTSTVTLRVVEGDEKGSLESETVKYGLKSQGTRTRERLPWQGPAAYTKDRPDLSSERAPHKNKTVTVTQVIKICS